MQVLVDVKRRINLDFDCNCKLLFGVGVAKDFRIRFFSIYLRIEEKKKNHVVILICKHVFLIEIFFIRFDTTKLRISKYHEKLQTEWSYV